jgi:hypothetical protein
MAYIGTTSASSIANPPRPVAPLNEARIASTASPIAARLWLFASTDTSSSPFTAGYFADGYQLGMKQGDVVICVGQTSTVSSSQVLMLGVVSSVSSTGGGTQLSTFSFISST